MCLLKGLGGSVSPPRRLGYLRFMSSAAEFLPSSRSLKALEEAVQGGRECPPAEVEAVRPQAVLAMGATAARSLFGPKVKVTKDRGRPLESPLAPVAAVTIHPSAILRLREHDEREAELAGFVADLEGVASALQGAAR